ncbi:MAG TPA: protein kinase [Kofleriaceae bacterium]|nr:protein kinase [Kofleriaceae bacterium]
MSREDSDASTGEAAPPRRDSSTSTANVRPPRPESTVAGYAPAIESMVEPAVAPALAPTLMPAAATDETLAASVIPVKPPSLPSVVDRPGDLEALPAIDPALYSIGPEIARGGMGRILAARDRKLRRDVVIKVLRGDKLAAARFEREALITARLQHPSIVRVYDAGLLDGEPFYVMEHVRGQSFDRVVAAADDARARLALLPHVIAIADALAYAHSEGVIHRDLKPANVLVGSFGETVVLDWGLAKDLRADEPDSLQPGQPRSRRAPSVPTAGASDLTVEGAVMGTPSYMPPEQARGEPADERSDVYAIGAILYYLLAGSAPVSGERALADASAGAITPLRERAPDAPPELVTIVEHAMAFAPAERYATARELADDLRAFAAGKLVARHQYSTGQLIRRWIRRHRAPVAVASAAIGVLGVLLVVGIRGLSEERDRADAAAARANAALVQVQDESDDLVLHQAERALASDPSQTIAWLGRLSPRGMTRPKARELADHAAERGTAFELVGPRDDVEHVVVADSHIAYSASDDGHVWRWRLATWRGVDLGAGAAAHAGQIEGLALSPDGFWLASAGTDRVVRLWDLFKDENRALTGHTGAVRGVMFSPDGNTLASCGEDGALWLWTVRTGEGHVALRDSHGLRALAWSSDGTRLWTGTQDGRVLELDVATGKPGPTLRPHQEEVRVLALSPDGTRLASGGEDGAVAVWRLDDRKPTRIGTHADVVRDLVWSPDSTRLVSAGGDTNVTVHDLAAGTAVVLAGNTSGVKDLALSADGAWVAAAGLDGKARIWPLAGGAPRTLVGHRASVKAVGFTPDGQSLVSGSEDDRVRLWPLAAVAPAPSGPALAQWLVARTNLAVAAP